LNVEGIALIHHEIGKIERCGGLHVVHLHDLGALGQHAILEWTGGRREKLAEMTTAVVMMIESVQMGESI